MVSRQMNRSLPAAWALAAALLALTIPHLAAAADTLRVSVDQATLTKLPERVATIIVGNPLIADVTIQAGGVLVVTGKSYGATNVVALDRAGSVLMEKTVLVEGPREDVVVVYRGMNRETYSCLPSCERRLTLGDHPDYFNLAIGQSAARSAQAQGATGQQPR
jgi:Pilus formation protein N terminal region